MNNLRHFLKALILLVSALSPIAAQNSEISGRVLDASKAAVGGAQITLTRTDTGDRRSTVSSTEGYYTYPLLFAGTYEVSVTKEGFQKENRTGITVETGQVSTVDVD